MVHFKKLLFYLFLMLALSAASVVSVLKLSGGDPVNVDLGRNVPEVASDSDLEETIVDPIVGPDAVISVVSSSESPVSEETIDSAAVDMETVGDQLLDGEQVEESNDLLVDSEALDGQTDESEFDFVDAGVSRVDQSEDEPIVFDENELDSEEDLSAVFDEVDETDGEDLGDEEIADSQSDVSETEEESTAENASLNEGFVVELAPEDEIVFDSSDDDEIVFDDSTTTVEEDEETVADESDSSDDVLFDKNESSEENVEVSENVLVFGSDSERETDAEESTDDDITVFIDALEANDIEEEIVFDDNDDADDGDLSSVFEEDEAADDVDSEELEEDVLETSEIDDEKANEENSDANVGKVLFKTKPTDGAQSSFRSLDVLEREAEFFNGSLSMDEITEEEEPSSATDSLESVKTDDAYTGEIVYDSDKEYEPDEKFVSETDAIDSTDATDSAEDSVLQSDDEELDESDDADCEEEESNEPAAPCGPVILCLLDDEGVSEEQSVAVDEETPAVESAPYKKAPTTIRVSSQMTIEPEPTAPPVQDELWIVTEGGSYMRFENGSWNRREAKHFFGEDDPRRVTIIWAHGYQTDMTAASLSSFNLKAVVDSARATSGVDRKYRIVVWKWDSERYNARLRLDAKEKKDLAYYSGIKLGKFVGRLNPKDDVVFVGFSFGAVVTGSALQTLATTSNQYMTGRKRTAFATSGAGTETAPEVASGRISLLLISAACDLGSFNQGGIFRSGAELPTRVLNVYNPTDYALKFYPLISGTSQAVGIAPLMGNEFLNAGGATFNLNANGYLGKEHSFDDAIEYISSSTLSDMIF